jgi:hypothetical protein
LTDQVDIDDEGIFGSTRLTGDEALYSVNGRYTFGIVDNDGDNVFALTDLTTDDILWKPRWERPMGRSNGAPDAFSLSSLGLYTSYEGDDWIHGKSIDTSFYDTSDYTIHDSLRTFTLGNNGSLKYTDHLAEVVLFEFDAKSGTVSWTPRAIGEADWAETRATLRNAGYDVAKHIDYATWQDFMTTFDDGPGAGISENKDTLKMALVELSAQLAATVPADIAEAVQVFIDNGGNNVNVAPPARFLRNNPAISEADGIISGNTPVARAEDALVEKIDFLWNGFLQATEGKTDIWTALQTFNFTLGANADGAAVVDGQVRISPLIYEAFFATNFDTDGKFTGRRNDNGMPTGELDLSHVPEVLRSAFADALKQGSRLFYSAQNANVPLTDGNPAASGSIILPTDSASALEMFAGALRNDVLDNGMSDFVSSGDKWQEFLASGFYDADDILNGYMSHEVLVNDALTKALMWVGKDVIEEMGEALWTGPSAADMDSIKGLDNHQVWNVTYYQDDQTYTRLVTQDQLQALWTLEYNG